MTDEQFLTLMTALTDSTAHTETIEIISIGVMCLLILVGLTFFNTFKTSWKGRIK